MTAKEYLKQIKRLKAQIRNLESQAIVIYEQTSCIGGMDYSKDRVQTSPSGDTSTKMIVAYVDMMTTIEDLKMVLLHKIEETVAQINQLSDPDYIDILRMRYIDGNGRVPLEEIAESIHISYDLCRHKHGEALREFQTKFL